MRRTDEHEGKQFIPTEKDRLHDYVAQLRCRAVAFLKWFGQIIAVFPGRHIGQWKPKIFSTHRVKHFRIERIASHEFYIGWNP